MHHMKSCILWQEVYLCRISIGFHSSDPRPSAASITMVNTQSPTSIILTWTQPEGKVVDSYEVSFSYQGPCSGCNHTDTTTVNGTTRQYTLTGLQEFSNYTVTVVAVNDAGRSEESSENVVTMADGTCIRSMKFWVSVLHGWRDLACILIPWYLIVIMMGTSNCVQRTCCVVY